MRVSGKQDIVWFTGFGSTQGTLTAYKSVDGILVTRGCFIGTIDEFDMAVLNTHRNSKITKEYQLLSQAIKLHFNILGDSK